MPTVVDIQILGLNASKGEDDDEEEEEEEEEGEQGDD